MRLISCSLSGFRRFSDAKINLDSNLIAIVGPNEAGKTSLLEILSRIEDDDVIDQRDLTRGITHSLNDKIIEIRFLLEEEERELVNDLSAIGNPRWYVWGKKKNGSRYHFIEPKVIRDKSGRHTLNNQLMKTLNNVRLRKELSEVFKISKSSDDSLEETISLRDLIMKVSKRIRGEQENLASETLRNIQDLEKILENRIKELPETKSGSLKIAQALLEDLLNVEDDEHPNEQMLNRLGETRPRILFFREGDRQLASDYPIEVLNDPPRSLKNLLDLARVNIRELQDAISQEDHGTKEYIAELANENLKEQFEDAWNQFEVFVRLQIDQEVIRILLPSANTYSQIAERSDGLRSFIALYSFISLQSDGIPPVLLIDEAEAHLHYDAQADLVRVFENQRSASQVFYSTHSAGCLPNDLGTGIRVIKPLMSEEGDDTSRSAISNSFWEGAPGFSPLLYAMGAGILASVKSRKAIYTEGASDLILLPSLLKEATSLRNLEFQVVPGLARSSREDLIDIQFEFPREAFVVDGDDAGKEHRRRLRSSGIQEEDIVSLQDGLAIEHYVTQNIYFRAVNEELRRSHGDDFLIPLETETDNVVTFVSEWCAERGIDIPPKAKIAMHIVSYGSEKKILDPNRIDGLANIYEALVSILNNEVA